jgi:hypothetical protein
MQSVFTGILHDYSTSTQILINWGDDSSGYAENLDNWIKKIVYIGSLNGKKKHFYKRLFYIYLRISKTFIHNSLHVFDKRGKSLRQKKM